MVEEACFKCKDCGCERLDVVSYYQRTENITRYVECTCGHTDEPAAICTAHITTVRKKEYAFTETHHFHEESDDEIERLENEEDSVVINCSKCHGEAEEADWEDEEVTPDDIEDETTEFEVICAECSREIEFGWSHENRGGRIWPSECDDFNPWKCFPEPKFEKSWHEKGWLRPLSVKEAARALRMTEEEVTDLINSGRLDKHPKCNELATDVYAYHQFKESQKSGASPGEAR